MDIKQTTSAGKPFLFAIGRSIQFLTVDIITQFCLGSALGFVPSDCDRYFFLDTVERGRQIGQHFSVLLEMNTFIQLLAKVPLLGSFIVPKSTDRSGVGRIMRVRSSHI